MHQLLKAKQTVTTQTSKTICRVVEFLGGGGQGEVYRADLGGKAVALKWYFPSMATVEQRRVLENLVSQGPPDSRFLWPQEMVSANGVKGYGYVMPLRPQQFKGLMDYVAGRTRPNAYSLITTGYHLADGFLQLHAKGLCYRDISFGNLFFDPSTGEVIICDNDNVCIDKQERSNVLGTPRFMAPEIVRGEAMPSRDTDIHSLAVLLFYLLLVHNPLEGKAESSIRCFNEPAMMRLYGTNPVFIFDPSNDTNRPDPAHHQHAIDLWSFYPQRIKALFTRSFTEGLRDPQHGRVKDSEWRSAMVDLRDSIMECRHCDSDNYYDDAQVTTGSNTLRCYWCEKSLEKPLRMRLSGQRSTIVLKPGKQLFAHHLMRDRPFVFSEALAEVSRNPKVPAVLGLRNLTQHKWVLVDASGKMEDVEPGRNARLAAGNRINFGGVEGDCQI